MKVVNMKKHSKERGVATIEAALLLTIFVVFMTYCVGVFGIIHTGILNSISSRAYAFETFRNRTNLSYFRDTTFGDLQQTVRYGVRAHGVVSEEIKMNEDRWMVTQRTLAMGRDIAEVKANRPQEKMNDLFDKKKETGAVNPVFIKTVYGICLNYECGGN